MKHLYLVLAIGWLFSPGASAQVVTGQAFIAGDSGNPLYPLRVQGADGTLYHCKAESFVSDGKTARKCVRADDQTGDIFSTGTGITTTTTSVTGTVFLISIGATTTSTSTTTTD